MSSALPSLEELRRAIDAVDDGLLDLILRRNRIVGDIGRAKTGATPIYAPAREAAILRRLLSRVGDAGEAERIVRIWRVLTAISYEQQGGLRIVAAPAVEWETILHFCPRERPRLAPPDAALAKVLAGAADLAVLPIGPRGAAWLPAFIAARRAGEPVHVLGRLPFFAARGSGRDALVVGRGVVAPSGSDASLLAASADAAPAGAACVAGGTEGLSLFAYAEYVTADDPRVAAAGAIWLGAYPRSLDSSGPRALDFV